MKSFGNIAKDGQVRAVASGNLPDGKAVVVNADGTVSVVSGSAASAGSSVTFNSGTTYTKAAVYDANAQKVVIAYQDAGNSSYGTAIVGTISGSSISFGSEVVFSSAQTSVASQIVYDPDSQKVIIAFKPSSSFSQAIVGTVSGTSISFGSATNFASINTSGITSTYDTTNNKVVVMYIDNDNSNYGTAVVGTVSGTSISFGSPVVFQSENSSSGGLGAAFDTTNGKVVFTYIRRSDSDSAYAIVGTVSGTSISFGTAVKFNDGDTAYNACSYDPSTGKILAAFSDYQDGSAPTGKALVGTVSGTSISFGTVATFYSDRSIYIRLVYDSTLEQTIIAFRDRNGTNQYTKLVQATISGTNVSFNTPFEISIKTTTDLALAYDANANKSVVFLSDANDSTLGKSVVFTASSANLTSENFVGFSDGVYTQPAANIGDEVEYVSNGSGQALVYDTTNDKVVIAYRDNSDNYGKARVGTVDGDTITLGSAATFESAQINAGSLGIAFDANAGKVLLAYMDQGNSNYGTAVVGTVSGTSISFGTPVVFESAQSNYMTPVYDANAQKVVIYYGDVGNSTSLTAIVATISGTSVSFGSPVVVNSGATYNYGAVYDSSAQKTVIAFEDRASTTGKAAVGTVSGTSISFGSVATFTSNQPIATKAVYDTNANKSVIVFKDSSDSNKGKSVVGTVSGTSISFGSVVVFNDANTSSLCATYNSDENEVIVSFVDNGNSQYGTYVVGTVSGTSISFGSEVVYEQETVNSVGGQSAVYDPDQSRSVFGYKDNSDNSLKLRSVNATSNPQTGPVPVATVLSSCSIARNQSGLTAGQTYFVQTDGTLGLTAATPSVTAGTAISATELIVKG